MEAITSKSLSTCSTVSPDSSAVAAMIRSGSDGARCWPRSASRVRTSTARASIAGVRYSTGLDDSGGTAFWLSDFSGPGRNNFMCIPDSHKTSHLTDDPGAGFELADGAIEVCPDKGDVVIFDRRIYHCRNDSHSEHTRRALFIGRT
jgi:hypothetical protein